MQKVAELIPDLKKMLVSVANLQSIKPEAIEDSMPLFGAGLSLDSIDMLEVVVHVESIYGIKIRNDEHGRRALASVAALAEAIHNHQRLNET